MTSKTALNLALEALNLAAESGGELDREIFVVAEPELKAMVGAVIELGEKIDSDERAPEGDDYNQLVSILGIN